MAFRKPKPLSEEDQASISKAFQYCIWFLSKSDKSTVELQRKMLKRGFNSEAIAGALRKCEEYQYVDDAKLATRLATSKLRTAKRSGSLLVFELKQKGLSISREELQDLSEKEASSIQTTILETAQRKYPAYLSDQKSREKCINYFLRRGFSYSKLKQILFEKPENFESFITAEEPI